MIRTVNNTIILPLFLELNMTNDQWGVQFIEYFIEVDSGLIE
jgi:hypothetical protein